ncbi:MAG: hypothetical protein Q9167_007817 [Letrouitia subvulpina]
MVDAKKRKLRAKWAREGQNIPKHDRSDLKVTVHHNLGHKFSSPETLDIHKKKSNRSFRNLFGLASRETAPVPKMLSRDPVTFNHDDATRAPRLHHLTGAMSLNASQDAFGSVSAIPTKSRMKDAASNLSIDPEESRNWTKTVNEYQTLENIDKTHDDFSEVPPSQMDKLPYQSTSLLRHNTAKLTLSDQTRTPYSPLQNDDTKSSDMKSAQTIFTKEETGKRARFGTGTSDISQNPLYEANVTMLRGKNGRKSIALTNNSTQRFGERYHASTKDPPASSSYPISDAHMSQDHQGEEALEAKTALRPMMVPEHVSSCQHLGSGSQEEISGVRPTEEVNAYSDMANVVTDDHIPCDSFETLASYTPTEEELQSPQYSSLKQDVPKLGNHTTKKDYSHKNQGTQKVDAGLWSSHKENGLVQIKEPVRKIEEFERQNDFSMQIDPSVERQHPSLGRVRFQSTKSNGKGRLEDVSPTRSWKSQARDMGMELSPNAEQKKFPQASLGQISQEGFLHPISSQRKLPKAHSSPVKKLSESVGVGRDWVKSKIRGKKQAAALQLSPEIRPLGKPRIARAVTMRRVAPGEVKLIDIKKPKSRPREASPGQLTNRGLMENY